MAGKKDEKAEEAKGGSLKIIIIAVVVLLLLAGVGVGAYLMGSSSGAENAAKEATKAEKTPENEVQPVGPMAAMDDFIVNILDAEETRYLKASMTLELTSPEAAIEIEERKAQVRDTILLYLSSKSFDEIRDLQGKLQMRADLIGRINGFLRNGKVKTIYFTDFVVQ